MGFEIDDLALSEDEILSLQRAKQIKPRAKKISGKFVPPIPFEWFVIAATRTPSSGTVACALWFSYRVRREHPVRVTAKLRDMFGLSKEAVNHALVKMEQAGIVKVERHQGRGPRVEIINEVTGAIDYEKGQS